MRRLRHVVRAVALACALVVPCAARAQTAGSLGGAVIDGEDGSPVADAALLLRPLGRGSIDLRLRATSTAADGTWRFPDLPPGRYRLTMERPGYRRATLVVTLDRPEPLVISIIAEAVPFPLAPLSLRSPAAGPSLAPRPPGTHREASGARAARIRIRQDRFSASDARQLDRADVREANTLLEDDVLRAFQRGPGVGTRDDYGADLWTRGAPAGQTALRFDGIPLYGGLHVLGVLGGPDADMLRAATFQPGVASAAEQGAGAGVIDVESRSPANGPRVGTAALSPVSARISLDGRPSGRVAWAIGARRSFVDALPSPAGDITPGEGTVPYAFADATARFDFVLTERARIEASGFWQDDRVFGDIAGLVRGNEGAWGARVARTTLVAPLGGTVLRTTVGLTTFDASVRALASAAHAPLHPATENHLRTLLWEAAVSSSGSPAPAWSVGIRTSRETHTYSGPGIDLARLLAPDELARRGIAQLTPIVAELERAYLLEHDAAVRVALWGERRVGLGRSIEAVGGLRVEAGDRVLESSLRLAPRVHLRWRPGDGPLVVSAAYGRAFQYLQSVARTDVVRSGLRASEVLVQAGEAVPALRSDVVTLGAEAQAGTAWHLGATAWLRASDGVLVPKPTPGAIDGPRPPVPATTRAHGFELSARRLEGRVHGFANYTLSWSEQTVSGRSFAAPEDRRHIANLGISADVRTDLVIGATARAESGAPYTRITIVDAGCTTGVPCDPPPVLFGTPGGQRAPTYTGIDLHAEWSHVFDGWSLALYGQLRNTLGSANAVTYHSSCVCIADVSDGGVRLGDRFDRGLPRLPVLGLRARF